MTREELVGLLAAHRTIGTAPRAELEWIAEHGTFRHFNQGEIVARHSETVDELHFVLSGRLSIFVKRGSGLRKMMEWKGGDVTGVLPYSRLTTPPGDTIVEDPVESVMIPRAMLPELIRHCYHVTGILVNVMTDRARQFTSSDLRDEKMISLGKLTAGFAHEVNNPASAALRDAKSLGGVLAAAEEAAGALCVAGLTADQLRPLNALRDVCKSSPAVQSMTGLALADREDAIADWLREHGVTDGLAEDLARCPLNIEHLNELGRTVEGSRLEAGLRWISAGFAARGLVLNIERAANRIHSLVTAAKGFTHMDRAADVEPVMIASGLTDTVALLQGKAKANAVAISLDAPDDLPPVQGFASEINQVWMNLIDNAIDAAPQGGHVAVKAWLEGADVLVTVVDDGPGIPPGIQESIFDPFFTTKKVGEGTGLGLDIARRVVHWHNGSIDVDSRPGRTVFRVRLPITGAG